MENLHDAPSNTDYVIPKIKSKNVELQAKSMASTANINGNLVSMKNVIVFGAMDMSDNVSSLS
jgi:hypothetical protein